MLLWLAIIGASAAVGFGAARLLGGRRAAPWIAGAAAWLLMLAWLLVDEYVLPYRGGGASMWPIAQLFGGTVAAVVAAVTCTAVQQADSSRAHSPVSTSRLSGASSASVAGRGRDVVSGSPASARTPESQVNPEEYDSDTSEDDAAYFAFVHWLSDRTATELREARGDAVRQRQALCRYYGRGYRAHLTPGELIDFLGVDTPSILDRAGYTATEGEELMRLSDDLTDDEIAGAGEGTSH